MSANTHDPDDPRYTTVHGGVQLPNTHDPGAIAAWASRPTGPLSDLYVAAEQMTDILAWLCDLIARVRAEQDAKSRADERERAAERVAANKPDIRTIHSDYDAGYKDGSNDTYRLDLAAARGGGA